MVKARGKSIFKRRGLPKRRLFIGGSQISFKASKKLWPQPTSPSKPARNRPGAKESAAWAKVRPHFDDWINRKGPFPSLGSARTAVVVFLEKQKLAPLDDRTIERWIKKNRPRWFKK
jgi:hypothetical protein